MAKIGKGHYRWDQHWGDYDIFYSAKEKIFYVNVNKLFDGAGGFFDSINESKTVPQELKSLHLRTIHYGRDNGMRTIYAESQKILEDSVNLFNKLFVTASVSEKKVILYKLEYKTESQSNDFHRNQINNNYVNKFEMSFKYYIAKKKTLGDNSLYSDHRISNSNLSRYDIAEMKEIEWSQDLEDFIASFSKSFDGLIDRIKPFFETEGRIMELVGKNILPQ